MPPRPQETLQSTAVNGVAFNAEANLIVTGLVGASAAVVMLDMNSTCSRTNNVREVVL
jgi:hypothetical protein